MAACGNEEMSIGVLPCNIASNLDLGECPDLNTLLNWEEKREEEPQHTEVQSTMKDWIELPGIQRKHFTQLRRSENVARVTAIHVTNDESVEEGQWRAWLPNQ